MSSTVIDSLLVALGFEVDASDLKAFEKDVADAKTTMLSIVGAASAAAVAIGGFVATMAKGIDDLADWAEVEQVALESVQEWGYAAQLNGSSLEAVKSSIQGVNKVLGEAALGLGRGAMTFEKLGLQAHNAAGEVKTVDELLAEVSDKMQGMSRREAIAMAEKLGIDRSLIPLLMKGREAFEAYQEEARAFGVTSEQDAEKAGAFQDSLDRTRFMIGAISKSIAVGLMPRVQEVLDGFRKWVMQNREMIKTSIGGALHIVSTVIGRLWQLLTGTVGALVDAVKWMGQFKVVTYGAAAALALLVSAKVGQGIQSLVILIRAMAASMATLNMRAMLAAGIIGGVAIAIGLLIDDFLAWKEGGDSVIGDLIEQFPWVGEAIAQVEEGARQLFDFLGMLWSIVGPPLGELGASLWDLFSTIATVLWPIIKTVFLGWGLILAAVLPIFAQIIGAMAAGATYIASFLVNIVTGFVNMITGMIDKVVGAVKTVAGWFGLGDTEVTATMKQSVASTRAPAAAPRGGVIGKASDAVNNNTTSTQTVQVSAPITINSPDPAKAGQSVREELNRVNRQATRNGQSAVAL